MKATDRYDYATRRVESWIGDDCTIHEDFIRADKAMAVARQVWEDSLIYGPRYDKVVVRNERTGAVCDTIEMEELTADDLAALDTLPDDLIERLWNEAS